MLKRSYLDLSRYNISNDLNELDELNKINDIKLQLNGQLQNQLSESTNETLSNDQAENSNSLFNNSSIKSIKYFVALIPNELKSCNSDFSFQPYIEEAQLRLDDCLQICKNFKWPKEIVDNNFTESRQSSAEQEFEESDFIRMLFDNLENIIRIPFFSYENRFLHFELNLLITSLISKIALYPHPNLSEYLLNPSLPLKENCRSLFSILHRIVDELQIEVHPVKQLKIKLNVIRNFLLGETTDLNGFEITNKDRKILEILVLVEEFCKELAAIGFVKNAYLI